MVGSVPEAQLITIARGLFGGARPAELQPLLLESWPAPPQLSPRALRTLEATLSKGAVTWLVKMGAWRERLWERRTPAPLRFDADSMRVLQWLLESGLGRETPSPLRVEEAGTLGSELVLLAALAAAVGTGAERAIASQPAARSSPLCRVAFPVALALAGSGKRPPLNFTEEQDFVLAALQPSLAKWWRDAVKLVARMLLPADVERSGGAQAQVLEHLFAWAGAQGRRERCGFLLEALAPMLHDKAQAGDFVAVFGEKMPLKDRHGARRAAAATLFGLQRLEAWDEQDRLVRFVDDGYDEAQARVKANEAVFGRTRFLIARRLAEELTAIA